MIPVENPLELRPALAGPTGTYTGLTSKWAASTQQDPCEAKLIAHHVDTEGWICIKPWVHPHV